MTAPNIALYTPFEDSVTNDFFAKRLNKPADYIKVKSIWVSKNDLARHFTVGGIVLDSICDTI